MKHRIPDVILSQHIAVLGKTGSGKTSTAKLAIEQVVAEDSRVCIMDPIKSDWWGLTSSSDGKRGGLPFHILGGPHGHVPLHSAAGKAIADVVATGALPLSIIDMAEFEPGGQARFFVDFAPVLLRKMRGVIYLVIEEAHLFAPKERSGVGAENMSIHWAKMLATAGRSKGIRLVLVTQRTQALHNALLGSCDTLIAHRLTAPADQEPVVKWLKANTSKEVLEQVSTSISSLRTGEGWICSGEAKVFERVQFPRIGTYDNTATPTGDLSTREVKTAAVDPEKLRAIIGDAVDQAKAEDPRELRKQLAEAQRMLARQEKTIGELQARTPAGKTKVVEKPVLKDGHLARAEKLLDRVEKVVAEAGDHELLVVARRQAAYDTLSAVVEELAGAIRQTHPPATMTQRVERRPLPASSPGRGTVPAATVSRPAPRVSPSSSNGDGPVTRPQQNILNALAWAESLTLPLQRREKVAFLADASPKSSAFMNNLGALRSAGLIDYPQRGFVALTDAGRAIARVDDSAPSTTEELVDAICRKLTQPQQNIVRAAVKAAPKPVSREELAEMANASVTSSAFMNNLGALRSLGLIEYPQQGMVAAQSVLFLEEGR